MTPTERKLGRPRDVSVEAAVVQAMLAVLDEVGLGALSMDVVAARAGVGKATIYRRWSSKEEMVIDAIASLVASVEVPVTDDIRTDLITLLARLRAFMNDARGGSIFPWLVGEVASGTDVGRHYANAVILPRRALIAQVVRRAMEVGTLRPDLDVQLAVDMITGPVILLKIMQPLRGVDEGWEEELVDALLQGWQAKTG
ncbi:MAG TPA: TetR/AcrR family transcriptional regulator [Acidimicrobiia bacterium]|nr:TetR/AcrR family transcriptional regulator [Acidimicrobiia bacterium]